MELKYGKTGKFLTTKLGSNRTFMELKYSFLLSPSNRLPVLIAPLWN